MKNMNNMTRFYRQITAAALICCFLAALMLPGCKEEGREAVLPPIRMSDHPANGSIGGPLGSLKEAAEASDAVACVRIGDWLGDHEDKVTTMFEAEVTRIVKGELPERIVLHQDGTSEYTYTNYPLFTAGNEMLVLLKKTRPHPGYGGKTSDDAYYISGAFLTVFDIVTLDSGESYAIPRRALDDEFYPEEVDNFAYDLRLTEKVSEELVRSDGIWKRIDRSFDRIFSLDELAESLKRGS